MAAFSDSACLLQTPSSWLGSRRWIALQNFSDGGGSANQCAQYSYSDDQQITQLFRATQLAFECNHVQVGGTGVRQHSRTCTSTIPREHGHLFSTW